MAETTHSPLPWNVVAWATGEHFVVDEFGANVLNRSGSLAENAAFIVRACNSHQQLVDALKGMLDQPETPDAYAAMIERAQAALVTAQER